MPARSLSIYSWNINGVRAAAKKGLGDWIAETKPDVLGLQEVRASKDQIPAEVLSPKGYSTHFVEAERKGYSGVGLFTKPDAEFDVVNLDDAIPLSSKRKKPAKPSEPMDAEGRLQTARLGELLIVNGYFPNGNGKERDNSRVPYKLDFYERLRSRLEEDFRKGTPILVMGDWNTAPYPIDLARPKTNRKTSGFLIEECEAVHKWFDAGWVDTFRHFHPAPDLDASPKESKKKDQPKTITFPEGGGHYTWWSQRFGVRKKNIGWRIDLILASPGALPFLKSAAIHPDVMGSDHCPISVELDPKVMG